MDPQSVLKATVKEWWNEGDSLLQTSRIPDSGHDVHYQGTPHTTA